MNWNVDLAASAKAIHDRYRSGLMDRKIVREWLSRLGAFPGPQGESVRVAAEWFRANKNDKIDDEVRRADLERIAAIFAP